MTDLTTAPAPRTNRRYGWLPDLPDNRDKKWAPKKSRRGVLPKLPSKVDLRSTGFMPPVYDQSYLGSCTANAVAGAFEFEQRRQGLLDYIPARLFIYYEERRIIQTLDQDSGAFIRDGLRVVNRLGAPHETLWPYDINTYTIQPSPGAYSDGLLHQATAYASVDNKREFDVKQALAAGLPVVFGFTVYPWFESPDAAGFCRPVAGQNVLGGHAVLLVGYFRVGNVWWGIVRNSWGPSWGQSGYCYMPLRWICDYYNADDFWVIQQVEG
jgi:C1A family cysteine protease